MCKQTCLSGFSDCDDNPDNGCETALNKPASCGGCGAACTLGAPLCANGDGGFSCVTACPPGELQCGNECVVTASRADHCGGCNVQCPVPTNGQATCVNGVCDFVCIGGSFRCGNVCASSDPARCGASCIDCTALAAHNEVASCQSDTCVNACASGWLDCNRDPTDGCESATACFLNGNPK